MQNSSFLCIGTMHVFAINWTMNFWNFNAIALKKLCYFILLRNLLLLLSPLLHFIVHACYFAYSSLQSFFALNHNFYSLSIFIFELWNLLFNDLPTTMNEFNRVIMILIIASRCNVLTILLLYHLLCIDHNRMLIYEFFKACEKYYWN